MLFVGIHGLRFQMRGRGRMLRLGQTVEIVMLADGRAPVAVDDQAPRRLVQQGARFRDRLPGIAHGQHAGIAFLHHVGGRIAVAHHARAKIHQLSVVMLKHRVCTAVKKEPSRYRGG